MRTAVAAALFLAAAACRRDAAPILLFDGAGVSRKDVAAIESVLRRSGLRYATAGSIELRRMDATRLREYRLLIMPGGNFVEIGKGLGADTMTRLRGAVGDGVNYLGICAGAFLAGDLPYPNLNLTSGVRFRFYSAEDRGVRKAAVPIAVIGAPTIEHYWEDGPQLTGWGDVVGKYPDGTAAIVEGAFGRGRVFLSGVHPEAPEAWRRGMRFATPASASQEYAATLIRAALHGESLPHL